MNQGIVESRHGHDDGLVFTTADLGPVIGMSDFTVLRLMSQEPDRLPPPIFLSKPGARKQKRVWLKTTVAQWLQERQERGEQTPLLSTVSPVDQSWTAAALARGRGRGRPRKMSAEGGEA